MVVFPFPDFCKSTDSDGDILSKVIHSKINVYVPLYSTERV